MHDKNKQIPSLNRSTSLPKLSAQGAKPGRWPCTVSRHRSNQRLYDCRVLGTQHYATAARLPLANGPAGTAQTVAVIRKLISQALMDRDVNELALNLVRNVAPYDFLGEAFADWDWVVRNIAFRRDVTGYETLRSVQEILKVGAGDCDDINGVLLPALLMSIGHRVRLVTVATDPSAPGEFTHIYPEVLIRGEWIPIDAATKNPQWGVAPTGYFRKRVWSLTDSSSHDLAGLGQSTTQEILSAIPGIETSAASLVAAANLPSTTPIVLSPSGQILSSGSVLTPAGQSYYSGAGGSSLGWIILLGGGLLLVAALGRRS
jgi:hypothetical protein